MIRTFLRQPDGAAEVAADLLRVAGVLSVLVAAIWWGPVQAGVLALSVIGLVLSRFLGVHPALDIAFSLSLLVAAWSSVLDLYGAIVGWDLLVHFIANGLLAAMLHLLCARWGIVPDPGAGRVPLPGLVVVTGALGASAGVVWEIAEWWGHTYIESDIFVGYDDTIGDLAIGTLGAIAAGMVMPLFAAHPRTGR